MHRLPILSDVQVVCECLKALTQFQFGRLDPQVRRLFEMAAAVVGYKPPTCDRLRFAQHYLQRISVRVRQTFLPEPSVEKSRNLCVSTPRFNENSKLSL